MSKKNKSLGGDFIISSIVLLCALVFSFSVMINKKLETNSNSKYSIVDIKESNKNKKIETEKNIALKQNKKVLISNNVSYDKAKENKQFKSKQVDGSTLTEEQKDLKLNEAMNLVDSGKIEEAEIVLKEILSHFPEDKQALVEMGMIYIIDYNENIQGQTYLEKAYRSDPKDEVILTELVNLYIDNNQVDVGLSALHGINDKNSNNPVVTKGLGELYFQQKNYEESFHFMRKTLEQSGKVEDRSRLAQMLSKSGQVELATEEFRKSIETIKEEKAQNKGLYASNPKYAAERANEIKLQALQHAVKTGDHKLKEEILKDGLYKNNYLQDSVGS